MEPARDIEKQDDASIDRAGSPESTIVPIVEEKYSVFSTSQKVVIVTITAVSSLISTLSANIYFPALTPIQNDLHVSTELVNLTVTLYMIFQGISPSFWGSLADVWGRRPVYIATICVYVCANIGLALSPVYWLLTVLRMLQAFGSSSVIAVGAGVIGDIATPAERGGFFGIYALGPMLGPVIGPVLGGVIASTLGWRWIFWFLAILASVLLTLIIFFLPETLRALVGNGSGYANPTPIQWLMRRNDPDVTPADWRRFLHLPNFLIPFKFFLEKDVPVALFANAIQYAVFYAVMTSMPTLFAEIYGLSESEVGICFLANGVGCIFGTSIMGRVLNRDFRIVVQKCYGDRQISRNNISPEFPIYRARLRSAWIPNFINYACVFIYGWMLYIRAPLAVILVLQFLMGMTTTAVFNIYQTLLMDLFPKNGASITASNNLCRCLLGAVSTIVIQPGINGVGVGWIFTIYGFILVLSISLQITLQTFGVQWRMERIEKLAKLAEQKEQQEQQQEEQKPREKP